MYHGSCMCGGVTFEFSVGSLAYGFCHCRTCQKASGAAFTANLPVKRRDLMITGQESLREYESSDGKFRCFCSNCGSPIMAYLAETPDTVRIRLGSLDTVMSESPRCHFFTGDKAAWFEDSHLAEEFERWPDRSFLTLHGSKQAVSEDKIKS